MENPLAYAEPEVQTLSPTRVANERPTVEVPYRLAVIGEAPGGDEEAYGRPFIGASGRLLDSILSGVGLLRAGCFVGNICQFRPPGNDIKGFGYDHEKVQEGWSTLQEELNDYKPNCILALGNTPLYFLTGKTGITSWRGSIIRTSFGKVVPSIHPAAILRDYKQWPLLRFDALRAREEAQHADLHLPIRHLELDLTANEITQRLDNWPAGRLLSFDIEGGLDAFPCCSVSESPDHGFIIAWSKFSESDQGRIAVSLSRALYRLDIPKVLQNSLYDRFVLAYGYKMLIRNVREDTMLKSWECYPELPKGLATIASIWTREPYYKYERKTDDPSVLHAYCVRDSAVTLEASEGMSNSLSQNALRHYRFNMDLLSPLLYMEMRGIRYDKTTASSELIQVRAALSETSNRLSVRAGYSLTGAKGSISATKLKKCLYLEKGYPEQKKGRGRDAKVSTDVHALLTLSRKFPYDPFLTDILLHRKLESIVEALEIETDSDGRVRCGYNLVGTETGRLACYTSPTGSGANLQTVTKKLRKLYLADEGCYIFQCDLAGADGWTVAAHCHKHGDPTMWEDYNSGLKPAKILALMFTEGAAVTRCSRDELRDRCRSVDPDGWLYFACKRIQHASNYGVQWATGVQQIAHDSYKMTGKPVWLDKQTFETLQRLYFVRYHGIYQWHNWAGQQVEEGKNLTSASGHTRVFFGRRKSYNPKQKAITYDHETWKEFLADEPQENTTYTTNLAMHQLWHDPTNRYAGGDGKVHLTVEPLHQVHDALIGQFSKHLVGNCVAKIKAYFNNPIRVAGLEFVIPFEGAYGRSWGELTEGTI